MNPVRKNYEVVRWGEHVVIERKTPGAITETVTRIYFKFKGVRCVCGCEFYRRVDFQIPQLKATSWSLRCTRCKIPPMLETKAMKLYKEFAQDRGIYSTARGVKL